MLSLNVKQKEAVAALFSELFNAENVIEINKVKNLNQKMSYYGISSHVIKGAKCMALEEAVSIISNINDDDIKKGLINDLEIIARCDGYCSPDEAVLLQALKMALIPPDGKTSVDALIFSMRRNKLNFDGRKATYIHPDKNLVPDKEQDLIDTYADKIMKHLDELVLLFYCFNYDFVYIPKLREDFGHNPELMEELRNFSFFFSNLPKECIENAITTFGLKDDPRRFTTAKFAKMLFSGRENEISSDHDTPAFLIKISDSYVIDENYIHNGKKETKHCKMYNFLYLPIVANGISGIINTAKDFFQKYIDMVDKSSYIVCPESSKRIRHFDLYQSLIAKIAKEGIIKTSPSLVIDISKKYKESLIFEGANDGKDICVPIGTYIVEYIFSIWCSENASVLEGRDPNELRRIAKLIWGHIELKLGNRGSDDYLSFKKEFSRNSYNIGQSLKRKKLSQYVTDINDYIPIKIKTKEDGPIYYRISTHNIKIIDEDNVKKTLSKATIMQSINKCFDDNAKMHNNLDFQMK